MLLLLLLFVLASGTVKSIEFDRTALFKHLKKVAAVSSHATAGAVKRVQQHQQPIQKRATFTHVKQIPIKHPKGSVAGVASLRQHLKQAVAQRHLKQASVASKHVPQQAHGLKQVSDPTRHQSKQDSVVKHPKHAAEKQGKAGPEHLKQKKAFELLRSESRYFGKYKYF